MLLSRIETKSPYPLQRFIEHLPGHHHLGKLEHKPPRMTHQSPAYLDESRLNTCQGPALYRFWQSQPSEEVAQIVCQEKIGSKPKNVMGLTRTVHLNFTLQV